MAIRITDTIKNDQMVRNLGRHQYEFDKIQNQLATGKRIRKPSDDPAAAANQLHFRTRLKELGQFERNLQASKARLNLMDGEMSRVTEILQRVRLLTVQAANGIYQGDNHFELRNVIAREIDQHLRAIIEIANALDETGRPLFSGYLGEQRPFEAISSTVRTAGNIALENQIITVRYHGDNGIQLRELERSQYIDVNLPGNQLFWGTNMTIAGSIDNSGYVAASDQSFKIDGVEIRVAAGDTIDDIIDKINTAGLELRAAKVGQDYISLHTTSPHQIWLEDIGSSTVLQDVGLINPENPDAPNNYADTTRISGLSLFDMLIKLRNDLSSGDQFEIGGRDLGNIDETIDNILRYRAEVGARQNRVEEHEKRVSWDRVYMTELLAQSEGIDIPETIINLKWLEAVHNYALNVGARIIRPQLLDFLR